MSLRRTLHGLLGAASVLSATSTGAAADKEALACIQAAEEGETARNAGQLLHARELFAKCAARECPAVLRHDCSSWLEEADRQIPSVVLGAHDAEGHDVVDVRASVDGTRLRERLDGNAIDLDPGPHIVRFEKTGIPPVEIHVVLRAGEKTRPILATLALSPTLVAPVPAPSPPAPPAVPSGEPERKVPTVAWLLGGLGVAGFGVFGTFGLLGMNDAATLRSTCAPGCQPTQVADVRAKLVTADIALGIGAVSLGAAIWLGVRGLTRSQRSPTAWNIFLPGGHLAF